MTERPSTLSTTVRVAALSGAAALAIWGGLSLQLAAGGDPALGPKQAAAQPERRVVTTTVIKPEQQPTPPEPATSPTPPAPTPSAAPTLAPAPAPAPAPVQTSTS